jgi:hypothetical protein
MSELAFNINGEAFEVVAEATGWRVRKMRVKGSPEVVYAREGHPLVMPITADIDDLRAEVDMTGRYRLDLVDQNNKAIEGAPSGYVQINVEADAEKSERPSTSPIVLAKQTDNIVIEAMRMNSEIAKSVVDRFPAMLEAAATLLRAADGAGLPARTPREIEENDDDDSDESDQDAPTTPIGLGSGFDLNNLVAQVVSNIFTGMATKGMPKLGAILDWRKAQPTALPEAAATEAPTAESTEPPALDAKTMAHLIAIQSALAPAEATLARQLIAELSPAEMRTWMTELSALSVTDAIAKVRSILKSTRKSGGAS